MQLFNTQSFFDNLTPIQKEKILECRSTEELERVMDEYDIELPEEYLDDVTGGKGRFLSAALAAITMFTVAASVPASASAAESDKYVSAQSSVIMLADEEDTGYTEKMLAELGVADASGFESAVVFVPAPSDAFSGGGSVQSAMPVKLNSSSKKIAISISKTFVQKMTAKLPGGLIINSAYVAIIDALVKDKGDMKVSELQEIMDQRFDELNAEIESVKAEMERNTDFLENTTVLAQYGQSLDNMHNHTEELRRQLDSIASGKVIDARGNVLYEDPDMTEEEKYVYMANLLGAYSEWNGNLIGDINAASNILMGGSHISFGNKDLFTVLSDLNGHDCIFYGELSNMNSPYIERVMLEYTNSCLVALECMDAHFIIAQEDFDTSNLNSDALRIYQRIWTPSITTATNIANIFDCCFDDSTNSVTKHYNEYIEYTEARKNFFIRDYKKGSMVDVKLANAKVQGTYDKYTPLFEQFKLTENDISALVKHAQKYNKSIAQILTEAGFQIPYGTKYLVTSFSEHPYDAEEVYKDIQISYDKYYIYIKWAEFERIPAVDIYDQKCQIGYLTEWTTTKYKETIGMNYHKEGTLSHEEKLNNLLVFY